MQIIGIIVEYNPFHNGHLYQINQVKKRYPDSVLIVVMSGPFTQRGDISVLSKYQKTKVTLAYGVDIVLELPYFYATQSADYFAEGSIKILNEFKIDTLVFGTEDEDLEQIKNTAKLQEEPDFKLRVRTELKKGVSYPTALANAAGSNINTPNNLLGISYLKAIDKINPNIEAVAIQRTNDYHSEEITSNIASATSVRKHMDNLELVKKTVPQETFEYLKTADINEDLYFGLLKYKINHTEDLSVYLDVDEGLENRIKKVINESNNLDDLINNIKSKRYTYSKVKRMLNHILIGLKKADDYEMDYLRILGFSKQGQVHINKIKKTTNLPIISCYKPNLSTMLDLNLKADLLYNQVANHKEAEDKVTPIFYEK